MSVCTASIWNKLHGRGNPPDRGTHALNLAVLDMPAPHRDILLHLSRWAELVMHPRPSERPLYDDGLVPRARSELRRLRCPSIQDRYARLLLSTGSKKQALWRIFNTKFRLFEITRANHFADCFTNIGFVLRFVQIFFCTKNPPGFSTFGGKADSVEWLSVNPLFLQ